MRTRSPEALAERIRQLKLEIERLAFMRRAALYERRERRRLPKSAKRLREAQRKAERRARRSRKERA